MKLRSGSRPVTLDRRDYSYHGTHRAFGAAGLPLDIPDEFSVDIGLVMHDQNAEDLPWGCTGCTTTDNNVDEMGVKLSAKFTYDKTCFMEGHGPDQGCMIRNSLKSSRVYGMQVEGEPEERATEHRGGPYFNVYDDGGLDWFDSIRVSIWKEKKGVSLGSPWFSSWNSIASHGILLMPLYFELQTAKKKPDKLLWHDYCGKGVKIIHGKQYLILKPHQGENTGDRGWVYMSREVANVVFALRGAGVFMQTHANQNDIVSIKVGILETVVDYLYRWLGLIRYN